MLISSGFSSGMWPLQEPSKPTAITTPSLGWCQTLMNSSHWRPYKTKLPIPMVTHQEETLRGASWTELFCAASGMLGTMGQVFCDSADCCDCKSEFSISSKASTGESISKHEGKNHCRQCTTSTAGHVLRVTGKTDLNSMHARLSSQIHASSPYCTSTE